MIAPLPDHLGPLHPVEQVLVLLLAFGPLVLLVVTVWVSKRRQAEEDGARTQGSESLGSVHEEHEPRRGAAGR